MIKNFLALRGNCVFFMDYSNYSSSGYLDLTPHFDGISEVLQQKITSLGNFENMVMFGFSFGARLVIDAGFNIRGSEGEMIDKIYACDPGEIKITFRDTRLVNFQFQLVQYLITTKKIQQRRPHSFNASIRAVTKEPVNTIVIRTGGEFL